jgi:hypothetical protein
MSDEELITLVREQRDTVPLTVPVEEVIRRGRALRIRRLIPPLGGALAVVTGVALVVTVRPDRWCWGNVLVAGDNT